MWGDRRVVCLAGVGESFEGPGRGNGAPTEAGGEVGLEVCAEGQVRDGFQGGDEIAEGGGRGDDDAEVGGDFDQVVVASLKLDETWIAPARARNT
jgi:hypothetical protein